MKKKGRPLIKIDWEVVGRLCHIQCTGPEISEFLNICIDTLTDASKREKGMLFSEYIKIKSAGGKASLRRMQWKAAGKGQPALLIWLGKQYLGQKDKSEISGDSESPLIFSMKKITENMDDE